MYPVTLELVLRNCREEKLHQFWVVSKTNHQGYISLSFNHWFFSPCRLLLAIINWLKQATWKPFYGESINWNFIPVSSVFFINLKSFNHPHHWRWFNYKLRLTVICLYFLPHGDFKSWKKSWLFLEMDFWQSEKHLQEKAKSISSSILQIQYRWHSHYIHGMKLFISKKEHFINLGCLLSSDYHLKFKHKILGKRQA